MTMLQKAILIALGLVIVLSVIVSMTLRHYIGGFFANVAREEEESEEDAAERDEPAAKQEKKA